jgi:hypothetical protein
MDKASSNAVAARADAFESPLRAIDPITVEY